MPFPDDLLNPIDGPNPSGISLRYEPVYDKIKEARREEDQPPPGMDERDRKVADTRLVIKLTTEALAKQTKDLQLAVWLTEAMLKQNGFGGLRDGLALCRGLTEKFWDSVYPELEDGDAQPRSAPLGFLGTKLEIPLKLSPIFETTGYSVFDCQLSREVGYEEQAKTDEAKTKRNLLIKDGKVPPELIDKAFEGSSKKYYVQLEKDLDECLQIVGKLAEFCDSKFTDEGPSFGPLRTALGETRHIAHGFLQKKREKEPDPVEEAPAQAEAGTGLDSANESSGSPGEQASRGGVLLSLESSSEPADRVEAVRKVAEAAAFLRRRDPKSPAPYLMLRGLRWGELRAAVDRADPTLFEAPPTELRMHLKRLALDKKFAELLETAECAMALPCSRAWLDLQCFVIEACEALGGDYEAISRAIRSELRALVTDFPQLLDATLMDDTPAANAKTRAWLLSLSRAAGPPDALTASTAGIAGRNGSESRWPGQAPDVYSTALQALREGQERKAFEILQQDLGKLRSGRERFRRKLQLVELCVATNKPAVAQPILDDLAGMVENHKLDEWEDPELVASALGTLLKLSQRIQSDPAQKQRFFERICRLDPAQALGDGK